MQSSRSVVFLTKGRIIFNEIDFEKTSNLTHLITTSFNKDHHDSMQSNKKNCDVNLWVVIGEEP